MSIELRQRSPLGALFRSPLGALGPGVAAPTVPDVLIRAQFTATDRYKSWSDMSTVVGPSWFPRGSTQAQGNIGLRLEFRIDSQTGDDLDWSDFLGLTIKSRATGAELTIDGTVYGGRAAGHPSGENVHLFPCSLGGDSSIEIRQRIAGDGRGWDLVISSDAGGPDVLNNEEWPFVTEWTAYDPGFRGTAFYFDAWGGSVDVPELTECDGGSRGVDNSKVRPYLDGAGSAVHEPAHYPVAYWWQWGTSVNAWQFDAPLTMEAGCFQQYRPVGPSIWQFIASNANRTISQGVEDRATPYVDDTVSINPAFFIHHPTPDARENPLVGQLPWYSVPVGAQVVVPWTVVRADAATVLAVSLPGDFTGGTVDVDYEARELIVTLPPGVADLFEIQVRPRDNWNRSGGTPATVSLWAE